MKHITLHILFCLLPAIIIAQRQTHKEIKSLEKTVEIGPDDKLIINGERTFIKMRSWDKDIISLNVNVISKHPDQSQAKADLDKIDVSFTKKGKAHIYSNSIRINGPEDKPKSSLKIELSLMVPSNIRVELNNKFGAIDVSGTYDHISSTSQFTNLMMSELVSKIELTTAYGDSEINGIEGTLKLIADRSNVSLAKVDADLDVNIKYGELVMVANATTDVNQVIDAKFSPVSLIVTEVNNQSIELTCKKCTVKSKQTNKIEITGTESELSNGSLQGTRGNLSVKSEIEDIEISFEKQFSKAN